MSLKGTWPVDSQMIDLSEPFSHMKGSSCLNKGYDEVTFMQYLMEFANEGP